MIQRFILGPYFWWTLPIVGVPLAVYLGYLDYKHGPYPTTRVEYVQLPDGRTVACVLPIGGFSTPPTCDWVGAR